MGGKGCRLPPDPYCPSSRYFLDSTLETSLVSTAHSVPRPWHMSQACVHYSCAGPHNLDAFKNEVWGREDARLGGERILHGGLGVQGLSIGPQAGKSTPNQPSS